jgi:hypothetical protein
MFIKKIGFTNGHVRGDSLADYFRPTYIQPYSMFERCQRISIDGFNELEELTIYTIGSAIVVTIIINIESYLNRT